jgi:tagatose 6-phosphate kinase
MILAVTLNPALDITYRVDSVQPHATHRVREVAERPGGKGLNVARVLFQLGEPVLATGLLGGATGARITELLEGIEHSFWPIAGETRRTVTVADGQRATGFWEPGPSVSTAEWEQFRGHFAGLLPGVTVVTLSGSLPLGVPDEAYAQLIAVAREAGVSTVLDAEGAALELGIAAGPDVVKPNAHELGDMTPRQLLAHGARAVVASKGEDGMEAVTPTGTWRALPPERVSGNPTGAGDSAVAALARGIAAGAGWAELVTDATAMSAAAVASPVAGHIDESAYERYRGAVEVEELAHRPAVRVVCLDAEGRILLQRWRDPVSGDELWEPPGGGVEEGEEPLPAARRELMEETGLDPAAIGEQSVAVHRDCRWKGRRWVGVEPFFLARYAQPQPPVRPGKLTSDEQQNLVEQAWVHWSELDRLTVRLEPPQLLSVVRRLAPDDARPPG